MGTKFTEAWLPAIVTGVVFTVAGGLLGWGISYRDTQTEIRGLNKANEQLQGQNNELHEQLGMLKDQNSTLTEQRLKLDGLIKQIAGMRHDIRLVFDAQGHVIGGDLLLDSQGKIITDSNGRPIMTSPRRP